MRKRCIGLALSAVAAFSVVIGGNTLPANAQVHAGPGSEIAFSCGPYICAVDGGGAHRRLLVSGLAKHYDPNHARFTPDEPQGGLTNVAISRDGRELAWFGGNRRIWIAAANGSGPRPLGRIRLPSEACLGLLAWNPDNAQIAYSNRCTHTIYEVGVDGRGSRSLVVLASNSDDNSFSFSPGGTRLAVSTTSCIRKGEVASSIFVATLQATAPVILRPTEVRTRGAADWHLAYEGLHLRRLTSPGDDCRQRAVAPTWSSRGMIAFLTERWAGSLERSGSHLFTVDPDARPLAFHRIGHRMPPLSNGLSFSPLGDALVVGLGGNQPRLALIDLSGNLRYLPFGGQRDDEQPDWG